MGGRVHDEFEAWWDSLDAGEQESIALGVLMIQSAGTGVPFPRSSKIRASRHGQMRELRVQHQGRPYRVLYAFDPRRVAILLIGGDKTGNERWYEAFVPLADRLFDEHPKAIAKETDDGA